MVKTLKFSWSFIEYLSFSNKWKMTILLPSPLTFLEWPILVSLRGTPTWQLLTGLCKIVHNILTNIWRSGKRTGLRLGGLSLLLIFYDIIISWVYLLNGFQIIFLIAWRCNLRINVLMTAFLTIFRKVPTIEGKTNVLEHFPKISEDCRRFSRKNRRRFDQTPTNLITI